MLKGKIGFIGAGRMAESLIKGIIRAKLAPCGNVYASDPSADRRRIASDLIGGNVFPDNCKILEACDIVVLAVKPNILQRVADEIAPHILKKHLLISIAPGKTLRWLEKQLGTGRLIRSMPNTPAIVNRGATAFCRGPDGSEEDAALAGELFSAVGLCLEVPEEMMDAVTGLSGSGPAYAFMAIQALSDGGVNMGLNRADATQLAAQTMLGAAGLVLSTGEHPEKLKDAVATPGGTTIEGIRILESRGLRKALVDAVEAATLKSRELGQYDENADG